MGLLDVGHGAGVVIQPCLAEQGVPSEPDEEMNDDKEPDSEMMDLVIAQAPIIPTPKVAWQADFDCCSLDQTCSLTRLYKKLASR